MSFDEISVPLDCCITGSSHLENKDYVFQVHGYTFRVSNFSFLPPFSKGVDSDRQEFAPFGADSFL